MNILDKSHWKQYRFFTLFCYLGILAVALAFLVMAYLYVPDPNGSSDSTGGAAGVIILSLGNVLSIICLYLFMILSVSYLIFKIIVLAKNSPKFHPAALVLDGILLAFSLFMVIETAISHSKSFVAMYVIQSVLAIGATVFDAFLCASHSQEKARQKDAPAGE
jgi:magnesium-transporting ATPase (P-type)